MVFNKKKTHKDKLNACKKFTCELFLIFTIIPLYDKSKSNISVHLHDNILFYKMNCFVKSQKKSLI